MQIKASPRFSPDVCSSNLKTSIFFGISITIYEINNVRKRYTRLENAAEYKMIKIIIPIIGKNVDFLDFHDYSRVRSQD